MKSKKCGAAYQCNSKFVHSCHTNYYLCARLQGAYCFLLISSCVCAVPFAHCSIHFATPCKCNRGQPAISPTNPHNPQVFLRMKLRTDYPDHHTDVGSVPRCFTTRWHKLRCIKKLHLQSLRLVSRHTTSPKESSNWYKQKCNTEEY